MTEDDPGAWGRLFDRSTLWPTMEIIIQEQAAIALAAFRAQVAADSSLTAAHREALVARAAPQISQVTRESLEGAWRRLQREAGGEDAVH